MISGDFLDNDGIWCQLTRPERAASYRGRPALFLDRDGVLVVEVGYLHRPEDVRLIPGAAALIAAANGAGLAAVLVTNQAGIGRQLVGLIIGILARWMFAEICRRTGQDAALASIKGQLAAPD